jgi:hypothetical protein
VDFFIFFIRLISSYYLGSDVSQLLIGETKRNIKLVWFWFGLTEASVMQAQ